MQTLMEWEIELTVVAESYILDRCSQHGDLSGSVSIVGAAATDTFPLNLIERGEGFIAVNWREGIKVGRVYSSLNGSMQDFERLLGEVGAIVVGRIPSPSIVMEDLNAKSAEWGSPVTDARGRTVWVVETGLLILNRGSVQTCVRWRIDSGRVVRYPLRRAQGVRLACRRGDTVEPPVTVTYGSTSPSLAAAPTHATIREDAGARASE